MSSDINSYFFKENESDVTIKELHDLGCYARITKTGYIETNVSFPNDKNEDLLIKLLFSKQKVKSYLYFLSTSDFGDVVDDISLKVLREDGFYKKIKEDPYNPNCNNVSDYLFEHLNIKNFYKDVDFSNKTKHIPTS